MAAETDMDRDEWPDWKETRPSKTTVVASAHAVHHLATAEEGRNIADKRVRVATDNVVLHGVAGQKVLSRNLYSYVPPALSTAAL